MIGMLSLPLIQSEIIIYGLARKCVKLSFLIDNVSFRLCSKLYKQIVGIPMDTDCAPLVAHLYLFCYERDFMLSFSGDNQPEVTEALNLLLGIRMTYFILSITSLIPWSVTFTLLNFS